MNYHLKSLILQDLQKPSNKTTSKLRLISRGFYRLFANKFPYKQPSQWKTLQGPGPVPYLLDRFTSFTHRSYFDQKIQEIGEVICRFRLVYEAYKFRTFLRNYENKDIGYSVLYFYPLLAQHENYNLAYLEIEDTKEFYEYLPIYMSREFIRFRPNDERTLSLVEDCMDLYGKKEVKNFVNLFHLGLEIHVIAKFLKLIYTPREINSLAYDLLVSNNNLELAIEVAKVSGSNYGGRLFSNHCQSILGIADEFLRFCSETGLQFQYDIHGITLLFLINRWPYFDEAQKRVACYFMRESSSTIRNARSIPWNEDTQQVSVPE